MNATARRKAAKSAHVSPEALQVGWDGALLSKDTDAESRDNARAAASAARRAVAAGMTPYQAVVTHVSPALRTYLDDEAVGSARGL